MTHRSRWIGTPRPSLSRRTLLTTEVPAKKRMMNPRDIHKETVLLIETSRRKVLSSKERMKYGKLKLRQFIPFNRNMTPFEIDTAILQRFGEHLYGIGFAFLEPVGNELQPVDEPVNGSLLLSIFRQKVVYLCPSEDLTVTAENSECESEEDDYYDYTRENDNNPLSPSYNAINDYDSPLSPFSNADNDNDPPINNPPSALNNADDDDNPPSPFDNADNEHDAPLSRPLENYQFHNIFNFMEEPATHEEQLTDVTAADILKGLVPTSDEARQLVLEVDHDNVFESAVPQILQAGNRKWSKISVTFKSAGEREVGVDASGLTREFFRLAIKDLETSNLFYGEETKFLNNGVREIEKKEFYCAGVIVGNSLLFGGPCPDFFADSLINIVLGRAAVPSIANVKFDSVKTVLHQLREAKTTEDVCKILQESEFLDICGAPKSVEDVASVRSIIEGVLHFYCVTIFKDATDQFLEGLSINDVLPSLRLLPQVFRPHFCKRPPLNSVTFTDLFDFIRSPRPSPLYNKENRILKLFNKTLSAIENGETEIKLEDIASWATGLENIPPTGLDPKPKIDFLHEDQTSAHPTADSCAKTLYLPVKRENEVLDYPGFLKDFVFAVKEAREYGVP